MAYTEYFYNTCPNPICNICPYKIRNDNIAEVMDIINGVDDNKCTEKGRNNMIWCKQLKRWFNIDKFMNMSFQGIK